MRALSRITASYAEMSLAATMETFADTGRYLTRLRVHLVGAPGTLFDSVDVRPSWNFVGIFGHNLTHRGEYRNPGTPHFFYGQVPRYEHEDDLGWIVPGGAEGPVSGASYAIPAPNTWNAWTEPKRSSFITIEVVSDQYAHYPLVTFGELVVGYVEDLLPAAFPVSVKMAEAGQVRNEPPAGDIFTYNAGPHALRELTLRFIYALTLPSRSSATACTRSRGAGPRASSSSRPPIWSRAWAASSGCPPRTSSMRSRRARPGPSSCARPAS